jgi:hypothetical protein
MTYTFDPTLSTNLALVRFHIGDTAEAGAYLQDETITALLTSTGSVGGAVIASIKYIITQLSQPNFSLDWLSVDPASARAGYENLLKQKAQEFGVSLSSASAVSTISLAHRADSMENQNGVYNNDADYLGGTA